METTKRYYMIFMEGNNRVTFVEAKEVGTDNMPITYEESFIQVQNSELMIFTRGTQCQKLDLKDCIILDRTNPL